MSARLVNIFRCLDEEVEFFVLLGINDGGSRRLKF